MNDVVMCKDVGTCIEIGVGIVLSGIVEVYVVEMSAVGIDVEMSDVGVVIGVFNIDVGEGIDVRGIGIGVDIVKTKIGVKYESNVIYWGMIEVEEVG
ncbi:hypothetical protein KI387_012890, partial [Taxus chinensis]